MKLLAPALSAGALCLVLLLVLEAGQVDAGRRSGGGFGSWGRRSSSTSSSSSGRGWSVFGRRKSPSTSSSSGSLGSTGSRSSYPTQQWGSSSGGRQTNTNYGKTTNNNYGGSSSYGRQPATNPGVGAGGWSKPNSYGGAGGFNNNFGGSRNSFGSHNFGGKTVGYSKPGYGTRWGTNFAGGAGQYGMKKKGFSKKALGLGVAAGFVGGAALGVAGSMATAGVYHRYMQYQQMMSMRGYGGYGGMGYGGMGYGDDYYRNNYRNNVCFGGCPANSHCEWALCECNYGLIRKFGRCMSPTEAVPTRAKDFNPFVSCRGTDTCQKIDMNLVCNTNVTVQDGGKCECRPNMKWNEQTLECQIYIDVDCSDITYDTPPSPTILAAVEKAEAKLNSTGAALPSLNETLASANGTAPVIRPEESLATSLLTTIDAKASEKELKEAFCRDVDAFSFDLNTDNGKPSLCEEVPYRACAVVYDSHDCSGGWKLLIAEGRISFPYFSSYWKYRNDIDTVGVREGCTFTGYSDTGFHGNRVVLAGGRLNTWYVLEEEALYTHMENDIESIKCECVRN